MRYHVDNDFGGTKQAITTTNKTLASVFEPASPRQGRVVGLAVGSYGAPNSTDCNIQYTVQRMTVDGTGTSATPNPLYPAFTASFETSKVNYTIEGTYTLPIWTRALNQRASMQWTAPDTDAALLWPATQTAGVVLVVKGADSTPTQTCFGGIDYESL